MCTSESKPAAASQAETELGDNADVMQARAKSLEDYQSQLYNEMGRTDPRAQRRRTSSNFYQNRGQSRGQGLGTNAGPLTQQMAGINAAMDTKSLNAEMARLSGVAPIGSTLASLNSTAGGVNTIADARWRGDQAFTNQLIDSGSDFFNNRLQPTYVSLGDRATEWNKNNPNAETKSRWDFVGRTEDGKNSVFGGSEY